MFRVLIIFLFIIFNSQLTFSKDVQDEYNKDIYCNKNSIFFSENLNSTFYPKLIKIKTSKVKSWYINLIKSFYSTPRSNWKIDPDYKKYKNAKIKIIFNNDIECNFKGKIKIHGGRKDHIDLKSLTSSLRVKIFNGHLNHSRHFALMKPSTRNYDNEIFITSLLQRLNIISPSTFFINVKLNNNKISKMIFQDMDYLEILRQNNRINGVVLVENKTNKNKLNLTRATNVEDQILESNWNRNREYFLNALDKTNYLFINENFYTQENILKNKKNFFIDKNKFKKFYLLIISTNGFHGYQTGDRRYYYNVILDKVEPIYYDWKSNIIDNDFKYKNNSFNFNFASKDIDNLLAEIKDVNLNNFKNELKLKGLNFETDELKNVLNKIIKNLIEFKSQKIINSKPLSVKNLNFNQYAIFHNKGNYYELCDQSYNCKDIILKEKQEREFIEEHEIIYNSKSVKFIRKKKSDYINNVFPTSKAINKMNKIFLNEFTSLHYNKFVQVNKNGDRSYNIKFLNNLGRVILLGGNIDNYEFYIEGSKTIKNITNVEDNYIPYCFIFYNLSFKNLIVDAKNLNCQKSIRFINSTGNIKKISVINSISDSLTAELSNLIFGSIYINNSGDDCIDIESGTYKFKNVNLFECKDKGFQIKRKSNVSINDSEISESKYGISILDSSHLKIQNIKIASKKECLAVYRENHGYYGSKIEINGTLECNNNKYTKQEGSILNFNNVIQN